MSVPARRGGTTARRNVVGHVVVVGAGVAGLAATRALRARGVEVTLVEAAARLGGRAWTTQIGADAFDQGAAWLHDAGRNPLVAMADAADGLIDSDALRVRRLSLAGRVAAAAEEAAFDEAWDWMDGVQPTPPDGTLAEAMAPLRGNGWAGLVALWEGATIAAADADVLGLEDWHRNRLGGQTMLPGAGLGAFVLRHLMTPARLSTPVQRVMWGGRGVRVETPAGTIAADAAIVTVSTGVLAGGAIRFEPPLPAPLQAAIHALPMGLLSKVAFPVGPGLDVGRDTLVTDRDGRMTFNVRPQGRAYLVGFSGGALAWSVAGDDAAAEALALAELRRALGSQAGVGGPAVVTQWGTDPLHLGAYAYAGPGDAGARGVLAAGFPGQRLMFAGEAARMDGLAGTVGGAYLSGVEAAERLWGGRG